MSPPIPKRVLDAYPPTEIGTWEIYGEDPNPDFGGEHHPPLLEVVTGTYSNVTKYAVGLKDFFQWGGGGRIKKRETNLRNVDDLEVEKLLETKRLLEQQIAEIDMRVASTRALRAPEPEFPHGPIDPERE